MVYVVRTNIKGLCLGIFLGIILNDCSRQNEIPTLTINVVNPQKGSFGTLVTISGTGFSRFISENAVYFNGTQATIQSANSGQLTVEVPKGAGTGPVRVTSSGRMAEGPVFDYEPVVVVSTLAGSGLFGLQDGTGTQAYFNHPRGLTTSPQGDIYVCDAGNNSVRKITPDGVVTTIAGDGTAGYLDSTGTSAEFNGPIALTWIPGNTIFQGDTDYLLVADSKNNVLRSINLVNEKVKTWAGSFQGYKNGDKNTVQFNFPDGLAFAPGLNFVLVSDYINNRIRLYGAGLFYTLAGNSTIGLIDGKGMQASFAGPAGLSYDSTGNLYVADWFNNVIRKIDINDQVTTIAGTGQAGFLDGAGDSAQFNTPTDVALYNHNTQLLVADGFNQRIRLIDLNDNRVNTLAGTGEAGYLDGKGDTAEFNGPSGVAVYDSLIYISDYFNNRIRKITFE